MVVTHLNFLLPGKYFRLFFSSAIFFPKLALSKTSKFKIYHLSVKQIGSRSGRHYVGLIWVQSVCNCYEQMILVDNELYLHNPLQPKGVSCMIM